ncbi:MAG: GGDEF domain-containing protein [Lachnospiraceae bacterium]|nr:GGDEF domain-containing protein [Lachnospiraceae bacterium]
MKNKKYRNPLRKSLLAFSILFVVLISLALAAAGFAIYRSDMIKRYQNYAGDAIDFIARCVDGDDLEECINTGKKSKQYEKLQLLANDFKETHDLEYIYIIKPLKKDPPDNMMDVFAAWTSWGKADGTDGLTDLGNLTGDLYPTDVAEQYMDRMDHDETVTYFRNDTDFGKMYTAIRPLFNSEGEPIAVICGDILIDDISAAAYRYIMIAGGAAVLFGIFMLLAINFWFERRIVGPVSRLEASAGQFEEKCRNRADVFSLTMDDPDIHTGDEIEALSDSIISMVEDVREYAEDLLEKESQISDMKEYVNKMDVLAYRDSLTGAGNKAAYEKAAKRLDWDILAGNGAFAIVMADLNYLKKINDNYGHDKGNEYIKKMYSMIDNVFKESPIFRIGGDEFLIIAQNEEMEKCEEYIKKVKEDMQKLMQNKSLEPWERISTAFGHAYYEAGKDESTAAVFKRADAAMYEDKRSMHAERE